LPEVDRIYLTRVHAEVAGDVAMPAGWLDGFRLAIRAEPPEGVAGPLRYSYLRYERS
jgi:dihydrofolate reductase